MLDPCPDPGLCRALHRHIHGRLYELYQNNPAYQEHFHASAERTRQLRERLGGSEDFAIGLDPAYRNNPPDTQFSEADAPLQGVGTELMNLLKSFGYHKIPGVCNCESYVRWMNCIGVEGCRSNRATIIKHLQAQRKQAGFARLLLTIGKRLTDSSGPSLWVKITDPIGSLVDEAINRATLQGTAVSEKEKAPVSIKPMAWSYGLMTVPKRRTTLLPQTLASLQAAGFPEPRLFVDGDNDPHSWQREFGLEVTCRFPRVRVYANWVLGLAELYARNPHADRYAMFQDDFVTYRNLRQYLEAAPYPEKGYWNLYTFPENQRLAPTDNGTPQTGWYPSNQLGKGAVALVFSRQAVVTLLTHQNMVERAQHPTMGWRKVDGGIVEAMRKEGWTEYVHNPSLVQHTGILSAMDKRSRSTGTDEHHPEHRWSRRTLATSFRGEHFDARTLLGDATIPATGAAAYEHYSEPEKSQRLAAWQTELASVRKALLEDEERLRRATDRRVQHRLANYVAKYKERLRELERNQPPFLG